MITVQYVAQDELSRFWSPEEIHDGQIQEGYTAVLSGAEDLPLFTPLPSEGGAERAAQELEEPTVSFYEWE